MAQEEPGAPAESAAWEAFVGHRPLGFEPFAGQELRWTLEIGLSRSRLEEGLDPLFLRSMDLPVQVLAPGFADSSELQALPTPERNRAPGAARGVELVLGEQVVRSTGPLARRVDGVDFAVFEISSWVRPERPGEVDRAAPVLRYRPRRPASEADSDPLGRAGPASGPVVEISGDPAPFRVRDVPPSGLSLPWSGIVAAVDLQVIQAPQRVEQDEPFTLLVGVSRRSPVPGASAGSEWPKLDLQPPPLESKAGFEVVGRLQESPGAGGLGIGRSEPDWTGTVWRYDLVATQVGSLRTPALEWAVFDPLEERHRVLSVEPLPVFVAPPRSEGTAPDGSSSVADPSGALSAERPRLLWGPLIAATLVAVAWATWLLLRRRSRAAS